MSPADPTDDAGPVLGPLLRFLTVSGDPGAAVYGMLSCGAVMAAESRISHALWMSVLGIALVVAMYWAAHSYASGVSRRLHEQIPLSPDGFRADLRREVGVVQGAILPILASVVAGLVGATPKVALDAGLWAVGLSLVAYEVLAGLAIGLQRRALVAQAAVGVTLAAGIVVLKALLG